MKSPLPTNTKKKCYCECHAIENFGWDQKTKSCIHCTGVNLYRCCDKCDWHECSNKFEMSFVSGINYEKP